MESKISRFHIGTSKVSFKLENPTQENQFFICSKKEMSNLLHEFIKTKKKQNKLVITPGKGHINVL